MTITSDQVTKCLPSNGVRYGIMTNIHLENGNLSFAFNGNSAIMFKQGSIPEWLTEGVFVKLDFQNSRIEKVDILPIT